MLISKIANSRALDTPTPSHSFGESTGGNAIYQVSVRPDGTDPPVQRLTCRALHASPTPRASRHVLLLPRSHHLHVAPLTPRASRSNSRCAQQRSDLHVMASSSMPASTSASTSVYCGVACRWAHVTTICFRHFEYVLSRCCKSISSVAYVAMTIHVCYMCMF
jgi:hypothetical protein